MDRIHHSRQRHRLGISLGGVGARPGRGTDDNHFPAETQNQTELGVETTDASEVGQIEYRVQPGDTLSGLARRFGISVYEMKKAYPAQDLQHCRWAKSCNPPPR